jgi:TetR/AcrR family transcriptional regulator
MGDESDDTARQVGDEGKGAATRRKILAAATEAFGRDGYRSTSVARIARTADVGDTITYAYFDNKEALFLAALDDDAAAVIEEAMSSILGTGPGLEWQEQLVFTLVDAIERHPLAKRVMAGLEPHVTNRVLDLPAMAQLRKVVADRIRAEQAAGTIRDDIDPVSVGYGAVTIWIALMLSVIQFGRDGVALHGAEVLSVFDAAFRPPA